MPMNSKGEFHMNPQRGRMAEGMERKAAPAAPKAEEPKSEGGDETSMTLHSKGDGTYHTESGGEQTEHPSLGHALMHMAHHAEPDGKHMHIHHDGFSHTSHGVDENGEHSGPHDHEDTESLKEHVGEFFGSDGEPKDDDEDDDEDGEGEQDKPSMSLGAGY